MFRNPDESGKRKRDCGESSVREIDMVEITPPSFPSSDRNEGIIKQALNCG